VRRIVQWKRGVCSEGGTREKKRDNGGNSMGCWWHPSAGQVFDHENFKICFFFKFLVESGFFSIVFWE
jgi:hypothetical protein